MYNLKLIYTTSPGEYSTYELDKIELYKNKELEENTTSRVYNLKSLNEVFDILKKHRIEFEDIKFNNFNKIEIDSIKQMLLELKIIKTKNSIKSKRNFVKKNIKYIKFIFNKNNKIAVGINIQEYDRLVNSNLLFYLIEEATFKMFKNKKYSFKFYNIILKDNYVYFLYNILDKGYDFDYSDFRDITLKIENIEFLNLKKLRKQIKNKLSNR